jgi:hypothetical protein
LRRSAPTCADQEFIFLDSQEEIISQFVNAPLVIPLVVQTRVQNPPNMCEGSVSGELRMPHFLGLKLYMKLSKISERKKREFQDLKKLKSNKFTFLQI